MDESTIIAIAVTALFAQCIILFWIIRDATRTDRNIKLQRIQVNLLVITAEKLGVDRDDILEAIKGL